jgi:hypothetical protein
MGVAARESSVRLVVSLAQLMTATQAAFRMAPLWPEPVPHLAVVMTVPVALRAQPHLRKR